jgi:hypothetical protein
MSSQGISAVTETASTASPKTKSPPKESPSTESRARSKSKGKPAKEDGSVVKSAHVSLDTIKADWDNVIDALKPGIEKALYYADGIPTELNENELVISFQDDVRKELASERRRRKNIQDAVNKIFGVKFSISFVLSQEPNKIEFQLEPSGGLSEERETIQGDIVGEVSQRPEFGGTSVENEPDSENDEEEVGESLRRTREAVREHPTVKAALSVFKGRVFRIDV